MYTNSSGKKWLSVNLIYYYGKIMGLCPLTLNHKKEFKFSYISIVYAVVISILYSLLFSWAMEIKYKARLPGQTLAAVVVDGNVHILQLVTIIFSWMIFALRQKKIITIIKSIQWIDKMDNKLGFLDDKEEIVQILIIRVLLVTIYFGAVCVIDQIFYSQLGNYKASVWIPYRISHIVIHYVFFLFITALDIIKHRFARLNLVLRKFTINRCREENNFESRFSLSAGKKIEIVGHLHDDLKKLVKVITDFFTLPILIALSVNLINIVSTANEIYLVARYFTKWHWMLSLKMALNFLCFFANVIEFFLIAIASGSVLDEANNTGNILHKIRRNDAINYIQNIIIQASLQLLQNKLNVTLCGLIDLNYEFMYKICRTAITYLIIVVQFEGPNYKIPY